MKSLVAGIVGLLLTGCAAYRTYDRTHSRSLGASYDQQTDTWGLTYSITPYGK